MKHKEIRGKRTKIIIALIVGFAIAMLLMAVYIYFGYTKAYSSDVDALTVRMLGIPIYKITKTGTAYAGKVMGPYMGLVCGICMLFTVSIEEVVSKVRH